MALKPANGECSADGFALDADSESGFELPDDNAVFLEYDFDMEAGSEGQESDGFVCEQIHTCADTDESHTLEDGDLPVISLTHKVFLSKTAEFVSIS
jgi:hypothetical protein